jgi:hypothetical protein
MTTFFRKMSWLTQRRRKESELREELQFHLDEEADSVKRRGWRRTRRDGLPAATWETSLCYRRALAPCGLGHPLNNWYKIFATLCAR